LSGTEGDDASVIFAQGDDPTLEVRWIQGGSVVVSMNIDKCVGEEDFEASYSVPTEKWLQMSDREVRTRLHADTQVWLDQARLACTLPPAFKLDALDAAAKEFTERLRYYAGSSGLPNKAR
jgi:hypothetical protein